MYRKGISKLLIAGLLLSGIQLPGTTGIAQADNGKDADRLSASTGQADAARAAGFADMKQHWASAAVNRLSAAGILQGDEAGQFRPGQAVSRAEMAAIISRVFRYTDSGSAVFSDVSASSWYGKDVSRVNAAGVIQGYTDGRFQPGAAVTRQEAVTMLSRAFTLEAGSPGALAAQSDAAAVSSYAREAVSAMLDAGYLRGDADGKLNPQAQMTRAELAELLSRMVGWISSGEGSQKLGAVSGNVIVNRANVQLEDGTVSGNLYVTAGAGEGEVSFSGIKVQGTAHISGGGDHSVVFRQSTLGQIKLNKLTTLVRMVLEDGSTAARIELLKRRRWRSERAHAQRLCSSAQALQDQRS